MFFKSKINLLFVVLLIAIAFVIIVPVNGTTYIKDREADGLLLMRTFSRADIQTEKLTLSYSGIVESYHESDEIKIFKEELEKTFSLNLSLASDSGDQRLIKYQGQTKIPSLPNTEIQVALAGVLHEDEDTYKAHLMISLSSTAPDEKDFLQDYAHLRELLERIHLRPEIIINVQGSIDGKLEQDVQQQMVMDLFKNLDATVYKGMDEKALISFTGLSEKLSYMEENNERQINVQIASRYSPVDKKTSFTIGTPFITVGYN
ncbi:YwmB family TATA-box binding protein [Virgibacillus dakarensis]|uniref:YwmB family TATA-box binding protein n=1 Tax=Virgibacillus dakarensis TaxID=1917889 RepID=UPI0013566DFB|nr:YwmB family TATA-box binding protein [Virgibacillus dakarensis]